MKEFPRYLTPANKHNFSSYAQRRNLAYMRKDISEIMIKGDENEYFDLQKFGVKFRLNNKDIESMIDTISEELHRLGWKTKTSFGNTALFVYSTEQPPSSCYVEEF